MQFHPLVFLLLLIPAQHVFAQQQTPPDPYEAKIRELLVLTGSGNLGKQVMQQMVGSIKEAMPQVPDEFWEGFMAEVKPEELVDLIVPIYSKHFTEEEVDALIGFYKSELGQTVIRKLPLVVHESMLAGSQWGEVIVERALAKLREKGYEVEF